MGATPRWFAGKRRSGHDPQTVQLPYGTVEQMEK